MELQTGQQMAEWTGLEAYDGNEQGQQVPNYLNKGLHNKQVTHLEIIFKYLVWF